MPSPAVIPTSAGARATLIHLLERSGLDDAARAMRRTLRHATRQALQPDRQIVSGYLAQTAAPRLHLGCGDHPLPGWLNSDYEPREPGIVRLDATRPFPLPSDTFATVFSEHMIEHVPPAGGAVMLAETFRVLQPGGRVRITTPDLAFLTALYTPTPTEQQRAYLAWSTRTFVHGAPDADPVYVINNFVRDWGHQFIYDEPTLRRAMVTAGFVAIERHRLQDSDDPALCELENTERMPPGFLQLESFTLEAVKPAAAPR